MNVAICDDNAHDAMKICAMLQEHFDKNGYTGKLHTFSNGKDLLDAFAACPFDVVFLDIYMEGMNGMKTAEKLRSMDRDFALVFITVSRDHAMDAYSQCARAYVPKPIQQRDIENAFAQCRNVFLKKARFIEVLSDRQKIKVPLAAIIYIEAFGRKTLFHTVNGDIEATASILFDDLEAILGKAFLRCHRSYFVNLNHVEAVQQDDFRMRDGSLIPLRQRGRSELREAYADFISNRLFEARP